MKLIAIILAVALMTGVIPISNDAAAQGTVEATNLRVDKRSAWQSKHHKLGIKAIGQGDWATARKYFKTGCDTELDLSACFLLAEAYRRGDGGPKDQKAAQRLYQYVCGDGLKGGCIYSGYLNNDAPVNGGDKGRLARAEKRCISGEEYECNLAGAYYGRGKGTEKNPAEAQKYYLLGCERNLGAACGNLGLMHYSGEAGKKDDEAAFAMIKKSCELKYLNGCADYSSFLRVGIGTDPDLTLSRKIAATACNDGSPQACHTYGQAAIRGQGGEKDYEQAALAFDVACRAKIGLACNNLAVQFLNGWGVEKK